MTERSTVTRRQWIAAAVFTVVSCGLAWAVIAPLWALGGAAAPEYALLMPLLALVMMFTPAVATLVALPILRVPKGQRLRYLGVWPIRPAKRFVWLTVLAVFGPVFIVAITVFVSAAFGLLTLDLVHFSGFLETLQTQLADAGITDAGITDAMPPIALIVLGQIISMPMGAVINSVFAFGEELGWRGFLLPTLRPLGTWPALLLSGVIWGLWHAPLILLGYNFGLTDWRGVALMVGGCVAWGVLFGWLRLRTGSVWPAVFGHGALNAAGGLPLLLSAAGAPPNMAVVGPLGMVSWAVIAVIIVVLALCGQFAQQPELAPAQQAPTQPQ